MFADKAMNGLGHIARPTRGLTFVEMMVALAVSLIVITGASSALIQMMRESERSRATLEASANVTRALRDMSFEVKGAELNGVNTAFVGRNVAGLAGDRIDNDDDGAVDEDRPDGQLGGGSFTDTHAELDTGIFERPMFVGAPDLGDEGLDADIVFDLDELFFRLDSTGTTETFVRYSVGQYEGESNVLLREVTVVDAGTTVTSDTEPLAHDVIGLNFLYWNANLPTPYWVETWDADDVTSGLELPASVFVQLTAYAGTRPLDEVAPDAELAALTVSTITNIEAVLSDPRYDLVRP